MLVHLRIERHDGEFVVGVDVRRKCGGCLLRDKRCAGIWKAHGVSRCGVTSLAMMMRSGLELYCIQIAEVDKSSKRSVLFCSVLFVSNCFGQDFL